MRPTPDVRVHVSVDAAEAVAALKRVQAEGQKTIQAGGTRWLTWMWILALMAACFGLCHLAGLASEAGNVGLTMLATLGASAAGIAAGWMSSRVLAKWSAARRKGA